MTRGVTFADLADSTQYWDLMEAQDVHTGEIIPFRNFENGSSEMPQVGDLIFTKTIREMFGMMFGWFLVVTGVDETHVHVGEAHPRGVTWEGHYTRKLELKKDNGNYTIINDQEIFAIVGIKRILTAAKL